MLTYMLVALAAVWLAGILYMWWQVTK